MASLHILLLCAALCFATPAVAAPRNARVSINILHVNDVHNRVEPATASGTYCPKSVDDTGRCFGGYSRIATVVKAARAQDPATLVLNAGDEFMGSLWDSIYRTNTTSRFLNLIKPDAMTVGNHEFDFGSAVLGNFIRTATFPVLGACNVNVSRSSSLRTRLQRWVVKKVKGKNIAILGVTTTEAAFTSSPNQGERFLDPVIGLNSCLQDLRAQYGRTIDAVIVLSHCGYDVDQQIAREVTGVDLVVGGHSHYLLWTGPTPLKNATDPTSNDTFVSGPYPTFPTNIVTQLNQTPVVTAYFASRYMGRVVMQVGGGQRTTVTGRPVLLGGNASSNPVARDRQMDTVINQFIAPIASASSRVLGSTLVPLNQQFARSNESNLGNLICDGMMAYAAKTNLGKVDVCLQNGGGIRTSIAAGPITQAAATSVMPFGNLMSILRVRGADLILALANGVSALGGASGTGRFPQVGGLRYVVNQNLSATTLDPMQALPRLTYVKLLVNGTEQDINPCAFYTVITNNFMAVGGDNYHSLVNGQVLLPTGQQDDLVFADYLAANSPVSPQLEGRIINCNFASHPSCSEPQTPSAVCTAP